MKTLYAKQLLLTKGPSLLILIIAILVNQFDDEYYPIYKVWLF